MRRPNERAIASEMLRRGISGKTASVTTRPCLSTCLGPASEFTTINTPNAIAMWGSNSTARMTADSTQEASTGWPTEPAQKATSAGGQLFPPPNLSQGVGNCLPTCLGPGEPLPAGLAPLDRASASRCAAPRRPRRRGAPPHRALPAAAVASRRASETKAGAAGGTTTCFGATASTTIPAATLPPLREAGMRASRSGPASARGKRQEPARGQQLADRGDDPCAPRASARPQGRFQGSSRPSPGCSPRRCVPDPQGLQPPPRSGPPRRRAAPL
ncbi:unnamed protein product [Prorocentrum cordatum]|uniref:Uncharacterized protein n=1 Tax=Prorocentrum cordatum TaxID=2364126 RepID=A0ABN9U807_9DINO|nr:unnamed protein product [Polarella glacialis]